MRCGLVIPTVLGASLCACVPVANNEAPSIFADFPLDSIVRELASQSVVPGGTRSWGGGATVSPASAVRHSHFEGVYDLRGDARRDFRNKLCEAIESDLRQRGHVQGTGRSGNICSVHLTDGDRHGWVDAIVWLDEESGRAQVAVILSDW